MHSHGCLERHPLWALQKHTWRLSLRDTAAFHETSKCSSGRSLQRPVLCRMWSCAVIADVSDVLYRVIVDVSAKTSCSIRKVVADVWWDIPLDIHEYNVRDAGPIVADVVADMSPTTYKCLPGCHSTRSECAITDDIWDTSHIEWDMNAYGRSLWCCFGCLQGCLQRHRLRRLQTHRGRFC